MTPKRANRILLLVTQSDWGGVQSFLMKFAQQLKLEGREVLLAAGGEGELWAEAERAGIPTRRLTHMVREINPREDWRAISEIQHLIKEFKPDAIHLNSSKMGIIGSLACALPSVKGATKPHVVYRIGGWVFLEPLAPWKKWMYRMSEKLTAPLKDTIITVHPGDERVARDLGFSPRKQIVTVANGLDVPVVAAKFKTRADARAVLGLPQEAFVFGTVANAYATKGLLPYLENFANVQKGNPNIYSVIIGDGPEFQALKEKRSQLGLENNVILTGHRDDATSLYPAFDVFVLPSRKEGMPWTLLEAMCASIPSITTDVGACRWMIADPAHAHAGIVVPKDDSLALIEAMRTLFTNPQQRKSLANGGKTNVLQRFSWEATYTGNRDALDQL